MNHQNNTGNNQDRQTSFKQNTQSQYTGQSQYNPNQYVQRNPHMQNVPQNQYDQQQTRNQNQYNQVGLQHLRQPANRGSQANQTNQQSVKQQSKMIKNPEKNIVHSPEMNDRDYLNDILATEKYLTDGFNTFAREASHTELHNDVMTILNETHDCTRDLFNLMFEDGFYSFQGASGQEVQQAQQKFSKYLSQQDPYGSNNTGF